MVQLRQLSLPYVADDDLLAKLGGGCCPLLDHLDVHGSWEVTNQVLGPIMDISQYDMTQ